MQTRFRRPRKGAYGYRGRYSDGATTSTSCRMRDRRPLVAAMANDPGPTEIPPDRREPAVLRRRDRRHRGRRNNRVQTHRNAKLRSTAAGSRWTDPTEGRHKDGRRPPGTPATWDGTSPKRRGTSTRWTEKPARRPEGARLLRPANWPGGLAAIKDKPTDPGTNRVPPSTRNIATKRRHSDP